MFYESNRTKLQTIKHWLSEAEIPWLVFAGAAAHAYGCSRPVTDLDIIVREQDHQKAMQLLEDIEDLDILGMMDMPFGHGSYLSLALLSP
jgi:hypothetical protein